MTEEKHVTECELYDPWDMLGAIPPQPPTPWKAKTPARKYRYQKLALQGTSYLFKPGRVGTKATGRRHLLEMEKNGKRVSWPFKKMEVGDYVFVPLGSPELLEIGRKLQRAAHTYPHQPGSGRGKVFQTGSDDDMFLVVRTS